MTGAPPPAMIFCCGKLPNHGSEAEFNVAHSLSRLAFDAFLFDMDGTILTSIKAAERVWARWAAAHGLDVDAFLPTIHGKRSADTIRDLALPGVDADAEAAAITRAEIDDVDGVEAIAGVAELLASLPAGRWTVVTSAPRELAVRRIEAVGLPVPETMVAGEDVSRGKPSPEGFLLAASRLGVAASRCLAFEDAPAGIAAAEAAGCTVAVITATHRHPFDTPHPTLADYAGVRVAGAPSGLRLDIAGSSARD